MNRGFHRLSVIACAAFLLLPAGAAAELLHFRVDPDATRFTAAVEEPMSTLRGSALGTFRVVSGEVWGDTRDSAATARVTIAIDAASYTSSSSMRDRAVRGSVLEADRFPAITFSSTGVSRVAMTSPRSGSAVIAGNLTLHGVTHAIRVPVSVSVDDSGRLIADGEVSFKYDEYGMSPPTLMFGALAAGNVATVTFRVVGVRAP